MANTTLGGTILEGDGKAFIIDNGARKESNLTPLPLYTKNSDETDVFDFGGVIRVINLQGVYVGTSAADVEQFISTIEYKIQGEQSVERGYPVEFVDDYRKSPAGNSIYVKNM